MSLAISNLVGDVIMSIIILVIFVAVALIGNQVTKYVKSKNQYVTLQKILELAKNAVVQAQKEGILDNLKGEDKFKKAVEIVTDNLKSLGITNIDPSIIENAIERAYAIEKKYLDQYYQDK